MTDEEFLKLARECGLLPAQQRSSNLLAYSREIERRTLEKAAEKCAQNAKRNFTWGSENSDRYHGFADGAEKCAASIRAMIKEKE